MLGGNEGRGGTGRGGGGRDTPSGLLSDFFVGEVDGDTDGDGEAVAEETDKEDCIFRLGIA